MRHLVPAFALALPIVVAAACYGPTAMRVEVLTDVTCAEGPKIAIYAGSKAEAVAESATCTSAGSGTQSMGDVLFAPDGDRGASVTVKVQLGLGADPKECKSTPEKCVFASRRFTYVEHEAPRMAVRLYRDCLGVLCGTGQTCVQGGKCVGEDVRCEGAACGVEGETPFTPEPVVDAGADAPVDAPVVPPPPTKDCVAPGGTDVVVQSVINNTGLYAASPTAFYYFVPGMVGFALQKVDRATLQSAPFAAPGVSEFGGPIALAADETKPWVVADDGAGKGPYLWNPVEGPMLIPGASAADGRLIVVTEGQPPVHKAYFSLGAAVYEYVEGSNGNFANVATLDGVVALTTVGNELFAAVANHEVQKFSRPLAGPGSDQSGFAGTAVFANNGALAFAAGTDKAGNAFLLGLPGGAVAGPTSFGLEKGQLATDASYLYWLDGRTVMSQPIASLASTPAVPGAVLGTKSSTVHDLFVDPEPGECVFAWSALSIGPAIRNALFIARKH